MTKESIKKMANSIIGLANDDEHIKSIERLGFQINPYNSKDEWELLYLKAAKILNFYEGDMFHESPYTYNLILTEIANIIKNGD